MNTIKKTLKKCTRNLHEKAQYSKLNSEKVLLADQLHNAVLNGHLKMVKILLAGGISANIRDSEGNTPLMTIVRAFEDNNEPRMNTQLNTILHFLMIYEANPLDIDSNGNCCLISLREQKQKLSPENLYLSVESKADKDYKRLMTLLMEHSCI